MIFPQLFHIRVCHLPFYSSARYLVDFWISNQLQQQLAAPNWIQWELSWHENGTWCCRCPENFLIWEILRKHEHRSVLKSANRRQILFAFELKLLKFVSTVFAKLSKLTNSLQNLKFLLPIYNISQLICISRQECQIHHALCNELFLVVKVELFFWVLSKKKWINKI